MAMSDLNFIVLFLRGKDNLNSVCKCGLNHLLFRHHFAEIRGILHFRRNTIRSCQWQQTAYGKRRYILINGFKLVNQDGLITRLESIKDGEHVGFYLLWTATILIYNKCKTGFLSVLQGNIAGIGSCAADIAALHMKAIDDG